MSRRLRRTKIVCTMGPATDRGNNLEKIIDKEYWNFPTYTDLLFKL